MKTFIIMMYVVAIWLLSGCAMVSREPHPRLGYRDVARVEVREHDSWWAMQRECWKKRLNSSGLVAWLTIWIPADGCSAVPIDPRGVCRVDVMRGARWTLEHELKHCHGYGDTIWLWQAQAVRPLTDGRPEGYEQE